MEIKSILIKDTTREERIRIVQEGLSQCGGACDFCNGCDNLGGGSVDAFYEPYINGEKELREINEEYRSNSGLVKYVQYETARDSIFHRRGKKTVCQKYFSMYCRLRHVRTLYGISWKRSGACPMQPIRKFQPLHYRNLRHQ